jgi:hypothetical protein
MRSIHRLSWIVAGCLALSLAPSAFASNQDELRSQQEKQRQVQAETDHVVRRITTMLRVMQFYEVESPEKKIMEEMSDTLAKLSKNQMADVIRQLEAAAQAKTDKQTEEAVDKALDSHAKVLDSLHELVARFDAVKSLDTAADRFEKHAKHQLDLHLRSGQALRDLIDSTKSDLSPAARQFVDKRMSGHATEMKLQFTAQSRLHREVVILVKQVAQLAPKLNAERQTRVQAMDLLIAKYRLTENLDGAAKKLAIKGLPQYRQLSFQTANDLQWKNATQLQELARVLRVPGDALAILKEAGAKIDQAIAKQENIKEEIHKQDQKNKEDANKQTEKTKDPNKLEIPGLEPLPKISPAPANTPQAKARDDKVIEEAANSDRNAKLAQQQAQIAFDTKDTANLIKPLAPEAAKNLDAAEKAMKDVKENLIKNQPKKAADPQAKATQNLKAAKAEIGKMIAAADKAKTDPLAALKNTMEKLDDIISEQTKNRDDTKETVGEKQNLKLPELANSQKEIAKKTDEVKNTPLPNKEKVENALTKATEAMKEAAKNLDAKQSAEAVAKQDKAIENLQKARNDLADKAAEIEKRQADIAKLEDAAKKLGDIAKQEKNVANEADKNANQPKADPAANKELAKKQADITPKANDIAKEIDKAVPKAAEKIADSTKNMEAAKKGLDKHEAKPAAKEAKEAAKKLDEAQKALENALTDLKGKQAADEIAMQKNADPSAAAKQIAEALKEAQKAAEAAKAADMAKNDAKNDPMKGEQPMAQDGKADLAKRQAQIAKQASDAKLPEAAKEAAKAAEAIKNGDIPKAVENQAKALQQLQEAAKKNPMPSQKGEQPMAQAKGDNGQGDKVGQPMAKGDKGQGDGQGDKGQEKGQGQGQPSPTQLAQQQKALMDATKALGQSHDATQAAQAALAQAQAQAPQAVQPQLTQAQQQLQQAQQDLQQGQPAQAGQAQQQAADNLGQALQALDKALAQGKPGQPHQSAKIDPGQGEKGDAPEGMGGMGETQGEKSEGQGQAKGKEPGKAQEKNNAKGEGNRKADGAVSAKKSQLGDVKGDGSFMHLPPRQRELIRQAMSGNLPPEYANLIQQYYINIARGRPASSAAPAPAPSPK